MTSKQAAWILLRSRQTLVLLAVVVASVWAWRDQGLFRVFADLENRRLGYEDVFFAWLLTFLVLFAASLLLGAVLTAFVRSQLPDQERQTLGSDSAALLDAPVEPSRRIAWAVSAGVVCLPVIVFWGTAASFCWSACRAGPLVVADAATVANPARVDRYVELTGRTRAEVAVEAVSSRPTGPSTSWVFIPFDLDGQGTGAPVRVVVRMVGVPPPEGMKDAGGRRALRVQGVLHRGLAARVREQFEAEGVRLERDVLTLDATESPADDAQFGWMAFGAGLVLQLLVLAVVWRFSRRGPPSVRRRSER
ncbi:MAG: hypothetical protein WCP29_18950 [Acidobacteriota bacterium]